jgi:hypothetical protein
MKYTANGHSHRWIAFLMCTLAFAYGGKMAEPATTKPSPASAGTGSAPHHDWTGFGWDAQRSGAPAVNVGITAAKIKALKRQQVQLDGTVDGSAIYLHGVTVKGEVRDVFFVTTTYGKTIAVAADNGTILWEYTPSTYTQLARTYRITTATPVADPDRQYLYAASPDGMIQKLAVSDGHAVWRTSITLLPAREKIASALNFYKGHVIAATGGYIGDRPPYQGHVAILDAKTGALFHVWNTLCSGRRELINPESCPESDSAIWGRAGVVIDPTTGSLYFTTGNGTWDGSQNWGDAVIELDSAATRMLGNYTPTNTEQLDRTDGDLGSTAPVLLGDGLIAQGGKDGIIRLLNGSAMRGTAPHQGGEVQTVKTPSGGPLFTGPAVLHAGSTTWMFAADGRATSAWTVVGGRLQDQWHASYGGTSPVVADGLLFVYDPGGGLRVYETTTGRQVATLDCGSGHWNSPIVVDGRIALPEGNANSHMTSGVLDIWR